MRTPYRVDGGRAELAFTIEPEATSRTLGMYFVSILGDCDGDGQADVYASDFGGRLEGPPPPVASSSIRARLENACSS